MQDLKTNPEKQELEPVLSADAKRVFAGLMLGMLVASISQMIVSPAMPRIVAELGGMNHYSWLATASMLVSAVSVPIVGKLSDIYGRRQFYIAGLLVFMLGSVLSGLATSFWFLVAARAVQGLGMGALMPLSQTIIGDIIPPRQRGKYQGMMGGVFGVSAVAGPLAGGFITDHWGWRWLFYVSLPVAFAALYVIVRFLHVPHHRREARIDYAGITTMTIGLVALLLAISLGGVSYAWSSTPIIAMFVIGSIFFALFLFVETKATEPVVPLRLFKNSIFTCSNIASLSVAMLMYGAIFFIPVYAQGVLAVDATNSGAIIIPMALSMVVTSVLFGMLITRTGRYKGPTLFGIVILAVGFWMLTRLHYASSTAELSWAMVVLGLGIGACMQVYTLIVQNATDRADIGTATAAIQFFRSIGATIGIAIFGTIMTDRLHSAIANHLPAAMRAKAMEHASNAGSVLDPASLSKLPKVVEVAVRQGLADAIHAVFVSAMPLLAITFVATLFIKNIPLRETPHSAEDFGREMMDELGQSISEDD